MNLPPLPPINLPPLPPIERPIERVIHIQQQRPIETVQVNVALSVPYDCPPARVLVADPPWQFGDKLPGEKRGAEKHYNILTPEQIRKFPLPPLEENAVLFMWRVEALEAEESTSCYGAARAWGFTPKSKLTWRKTRPCKECKRGKDQSLCDYCKGRGFVVAMGMGRYTRRATEDCIIAVRGRCMPEDKGTIDIFDADRGEHSEKPERFYSIVEKLYPKGPYVELFARRPRKGWYTYGNELQAQGLTP